MILTVKHFSQVASFATTTPKTPAHRSTNRNLRSAAQGPCLCVCICLASFVTAQEPPAAPIPDPTPPRAVAPTDPPVTPGRRKPEERAATKLKGLLITGGCCHDYVKQTLILTEGLSQRISISWDIVHGKNERTTKLDVYSTPDWAKGYDLVIHNECYGAVNDVDFVEQIVSGHTKSGVAAVVIHCSMHTYRAAQTDEWRKFLGVTSRRHEKGGRQLQVSPAQPDHPIMAGFPKSWKTPMGELYVIENVWPQTTPLATAYGVDTKQNHPCIWTNQYGKARVFGTTLGHHNETMMDPVWLDTVARGALWAMNKLNKDGTPMKGYEGKGLAPFSFQRESGMPTEADWSRSVKFPESERPTPLFNGKDLEGWQGAIERFSVENGEIVAKNSKEHAPAVSTYLLTKKKYRNFRLVFEGKLVESKMHSGIALWGRQVQKDDEPHSYQGHLVMFPGKWGFWDLYRRNSIYRDSQGLAQRAAKADAWNRMEILAIGNRIRLAVNGQAVADWEDPHPELCEAGPIGLQLHSNRVAQEVRFRGLVLSENPQPRLITLD